jgi:hypothetical protein
VKIQEALNKISDNIISLGYDINSSEWQTLETFMLGQEDAANKAKKNVVCSSDPCKYCVHEGKKVICNPCYEYAGFQGRKLTPIK